MVKRLLLFEFVRYMAFDDVIFEGYDDPWGRETAKFDARTQDTQAKAANKQQEDVVRPIKAALVDFIINQLPNVRFGQNRLNLEEIVLNGGGNLGSTLADPKMVDFFRMLGMSVRGWLSQLKGELQQQATALLKPFGGNVSQLVKAIAPDVSAKLQQTKQNEIK